MEKCSNLLVKGHPKGERKDRGNGGEKGGTLLLDSQPDPKADLMTDGGLDRLQVKVELVLAKKDEKKNKKKKECCENEEEQIEVTGEDEAEKESTAKSESQCSSGGCSCHGPGEGKDKGAGGRKSARVSEQLGFIVPWVGKHFGSSVSGQQRSLSSRSFVNGSACRSQAAED